MGRSVDLRYSVGFGADWYCRRRGLLRRSGLEAGCARTHHRRPAGGRAQSPGTHRRIVVRQKIPRRETARAPRLGCDSGGTRRSTSRDQILRHSAARPCRTDRRFEAIAEFDRELCACAVCLMPGRCLMVQGTSSDAGKSTLVTGLCRVLKRRGGRVAPFKPQNMALNSAVAADGGEIGRAQALQAQAAGIATSSDLNPVLLKPNSDVGAQVIIHGRAIGNMLAGEYHDYKRIAHGAVMAAYARLVQQYAAIVAEGAGSPAEINLRAGDIANMGFAEAIDCPVLLIADIERGGVFAHLVGTLALLSDSERARVAGFVVNRFRVDISLLESGLRWLERHTGKPV